jgi:geranylgeranyl reductase family protein
MPVKNHFDTLIVGAGPAGTTAAFILASMGYKVGIIEKSRFPRSKLCAGLLTQKTIQTLKDVFNIDLCGLKSQGVIQYQSSYYSVGDKNTEKLHGKLNFPFHFVDRKSYDQCWLDKAVDAGARVIFKEKVVAVDITAGKVATQTGRQFYGDVIIGADGVFSQVRSRLKRSGVIKNHRSQEVAAALEIFIPKEKFPELPDHPAIYFGYIPWGYAWSFPGPKNQILGICGLKKKNKKYLTRSFESFLQSHAVPMHKSCHAKGYALPYGNYLSKPGYGNILLIGDAGGLADPFLGEGIYYAHKSGQLAANAIKQSSGSPQDAFTIYSVLLNRSIIPELKFARINRQLLFSLPSKWYFKGLSFFLKQIPKKCEETIQGQRSFKLLRPIRH